MTESIKALRTANTKLRERIDELEQIALQRGKQSDRIYMRKMREYARENGIKLADLPEHFRNKTDVPLWRLRKSLKDSNSLQDPTVQVKVLMSIGMTPSDIDTQLGFEPGTACGCMTDSWYLDKCEHQKR